jgi:glutamyl-tRNA synthetase
VRTFLVNWALARQQGWQVVLRIEDLDGPRVKPGATEETIALLKWLGLDWDEGPYFQLTDLTPYEAALARLAVQGDIYRCRCTRRQIEAASLSAPHAEDHELRYPGTCRPESRRPCPWKARANDESAWRLWVDAGVTSFIDPFAGQQNYHVGQQVGDFLVATKGGLPSYQLAVVVDDARQRITQVVRGDDLLSSTPRQMLLYEKLGLGPPPTSTHLPLVVGADGRRLAKRHGDTRLSHYRRLGVPAERVVGLVAQWCGLDPRQEMSADEFAARFALRSLPHEQVVFTPQDDAWLLGMTDR